MSNASILLVDDDVELLKALSKVLERDGYKVVARSSATEAINDLQSTESKYDLVISDVSMPGMKGTTFLVALRTAFPKLPVVIMTAFGEWGQYADVLREGAFEYLMKPLDRTELLDCVKRALGSGVNGRSKSERKP